jgi:hypothetical protein
MGMPSPAGIIHCSAQSLSGGSTLHQEKRPLNIRSAAVIKLYNAFVGLEQCVDTRRYRRSLRYNNQYAK